MKMLWTRVLVWAILFVVSFGSAYGEKLHVMPFDVDPAVVIDGCLDDWEEMPNPIVLQLITTSRTGGMRKALLEGAVNIPCYSNKRPSAC